MPTKLVVLLGNGPIVVAGTVAAVGFVVAAAVGTIKVNDRDIAEGVGVTVVQTLTEPDTFVELDDVLPRDAEPVEGQVGTVTEPDTFVELDDVPPRDAEPVEGQGGTVTEPDTFVEPDDVPQFDVVRVDGRGDVVIGGRARPRASVLVLLDGVAIGETDASAAGHFVAMLSISPAEVPRVLSLVAQVDDGAAIPGEDTVIIAPFELTEEAPLVEVETTPGPDGEVTSPSVLLANADGVRVLQPSSAAPDAETGLSWTRFPMILMGMYRWLVAVQPRWGCGSHSMTVRCRWSKWDRRVNGGSICPMSTQAPTCSASNRWPRTG